MSKLTDTVAEMEAEIAREAERRALRKVATVFAKVLLTMNGPVDYDEWAQATMRAMDELTSEGLIEGSFEDRVILGESGIPYHEYHPKPKA